MTTKLKPVHPGEILLKEFIEPLGITQYQLSKGICVPQARISKIVKGERSISPDTALRLGKYLHTTPEFWMNLQTNYDLKVEMRRTGKKISQEVQPLDLDEAA